MSVSLRGFFSAMGRSGLVALVKEAVGSKSIVSVMEGCLIDKVVVSSRCRSSVIKAPRNKGLSPLLTGVVLGRLSGRVRGEKLGFMQCTSSYVVVIKDRVSTGEIVEGVSQFVRRGLKLGIGVAGDGMSEPDKLGCLKFKFCFSSETRRFGTGPRTGSMTGFGGEVGRLAYHD